MHIGGLQKNSFIDYPGKVSCVLFLSGCNFECPYCHNPDLVSPRPPFPDFLNEKTVLDFLQERKGFLDGVVVSGGEPTLQKDLKPLCKNIKEMGYPVKLDTNGSRPHVVKQLIDEGLVDYLSMDIKTDPCHYSFFTKMNCDSDRILSTIRIIMDSDLPYEFKTTCIKPLVNTNVIETISRLIEGSMLYALQRFQNTEVLLPEFFEENECGIDDEELLHLKSIAEPHVKNCIIR